MSRALGWLLLGGLLGGVGFWAVREHGSWIREHVPWAREAKAAPPAPDPVEPDEPTRDETKPDEPAPTRLTFEPDVRCCIPRTELGTRPLLAASDALAERWPSRSITGTDRIRVGDRVAFAVEVGSSPSTVARELVTGRVLETVPEGYRVQVEDSPALACRHGLCEGATIDLARVHVLVWSGAPPRRITTPIEWRHEPDDAGVFVRQIRVGQPFEIPLPWHHERMAWSIEPAGAAEVGVLGVGEGVARLMFTRGPSAGRVEIRLRDQSEWGPLDAGRWAFQFNRA